MQIVEVKYSELTHEQINVLVDNAYTEGVGYVKRREGNKKVAYIRMPKTLYDEIMNLNKKT